MYGLPLKPGKVYTWRRFGVLLRGLGADSRFHKVLREKNPPPQSSDPVDTGSWDRAEQLLAVIVDQLIVANWQRGGDKKKPSLMFAGEKKTKPLRALPALPQDEIRRRLDARAPKGG